MSEERTASEEELEALLGEADAIAQTEDWDKAIAAYRKVLSFDRFYRGTEAKLQWAIRMRDTENLYKKGQAELAAGQFANARQHLNKARLLYASSYKDADKLIIETWHAEGKAAFDAGKLDEALTALRRVRELSKSHYKDTDALIVEAETQMQKNKWNARTGQTKPKGCFLFGALAGIVLSVVFALAACASSTNSTSAGVASKIAPAQRSNMYKSLPPMTIDVNKQYFATIKTAKGDIKLELYPKDAPQHVNSFVFLARDGFYNNLTFHRVEPGFVIQGGDPLGTGTGGPGYGIPPEIKRPHPKGALAMARVNGPAQTTPSSGSQFYITLDATPNLDGQYTSFGQVVEGTDVVEKVRRGDLIQTIVIEEK